MVSDSVTVAGIDCGTNSIRLKVARVHPDGRMDDVVPRMLRVVRLGQGVDRTHRFAPEALERTYAASREFAAVLAGCRIDGLRFVATSATRDADNRDEFEDGVESILGVRPEVISGTEEADLSFLAATGIVRRSELRPPYLVIDLGGGVDRDGYGRRWRRIAVHESQPGFFHGRRLGEDDRAPSSVGSPHGGSDRIRPKGCGRAHR